MKALAIAYLLTIATFCLPLACSKNVPHPGLSAPEGCDPPECVLAMDTARALQEALWRAMDSLRWVDPCRKEWSEARGDSVWRCPDPKPPAAP
jgi:hypothetical protein